MTELKFVKPEKLSIKNHPQLNEKWVQERIAEDPSILGLGDLQLKDIEKIQPGAGRLDLLLRDPETEERYEVEIQLGATDESHIIRTIEYWDLERKRYPQYDHHAVIVAEDITSRFLNVISLFNGHIPLIALQMRLIKIGDQISLIFTKVLDELALGFEEDEEGPEADRDYWTKYSGMEIISLADELLKIIHNFAPGFKLKYNKQYIGLAKEGMANNFVWFTPRKKCLLIEGKLGKLEEILNKLRETGLDVTEYPKWGTYRIKFTEKDLHKNMEILSSLLEKAYKASLE